MPHFCGRTHANRKHLGNSLTRFAAEPVTAGGQTGPTREEIAALAYTFWEARGKPVGSSWEDWFRAERALGAVAE